MILSKGLARLGGVIAVAALLLSAGLVSMPSAHAQAAPEIMYGPAASADSVIMASVDGVECKAATNDATDAYESGFGWLLQLDPDECGASLGSEVSFTVDGEAADQTATWSGGVTELTLTVTPMETPVETMTPVETPETPVETMTPEIVVSPTGNAGLAATSSSSPWLALSLGALAVAMLAGARSVTGRSR